MYICEVPVRKPTGSLIIAVMIADLVLLQALWYLLHLIMTWWVEKNDDKAFHCKGCIDVKAKMDGPNAYVDTARP